MRCRWVAFAIVMVASILTHEGMMAADGHEPLANTDPVTSQGHHGGHHAAEPAHAPPASRGPGELPVPCVISRQVVTHNQEMSPQLDHAPVGTLPIAIELSRFLATSRDQVATPPAHPPDLDRAYFQVYRI